MNKLHDSEILKLLHTSMRCHGLTTKVLAKLSDDAFTKEARAALEELLGRQEDMAEQLQEVLERVAEEYKNER